jgi:hypothetical protein
LTHWVSIWLTGPSVSHRTLPHKAFLAQISVETTLLIRPFLL